VPKPRRYTEAQAAAQLDISIATLRRWRRKGAIGFNFTPGGRFFYEESDLERLRMSMKVPQRIGLNLTDHT